MNKPRASTASILENKQTQHALIMLHGGEIQLTLAKRRCKETGFIPIIIDRPNYEDQDDSSDLSITRLKACLEEHENKKIGFVFVEGNYSYQDYHRKKTPNTALLNFIIETFENCPIFVTSMTDDCIQALKNSEKLKDKIIITDIAYTIITKTIIPTPNSRKSSLPENTRQHSSDSADFDSGLDFK